jgi:ubiquitin-protein ligase
MTTPAGIIKAFATRRLMAEWRDYTLTPASIKKYINIQPLESNIFEWHGNLAPPVEHPYYSGCIFHFIFYFPEDYPKHPPSIELKTGFTHSNIIPNRWHEGRQYAYFLCMDVINNFFWEQDNGQNEYRGWSSAYSVETLLLQLYTFLFEERVENYDGKSKLTLYQKPPELGNGKYSHTEIRDNLSGAWRECQDFNCAGCGHTYLAPVPVVQPSAYKNLDDVNLRAPLGQLRLQIKPNTINWEQDCPDQAKIAEQLLSEMRATSGEPTNASKNDYYILFSQNITAIITKQIQKYIKALIKLADETYKSDDTKTPNFISLLSKDYPLLAGYYYHVFNQEKHYGTKLTDISSNILPKAVLDITITSPKCAVFGFCQPNNDSFLTTTDLVNRLTNYFVVDGARFLNDFIVIYGNVFPNKTKYWNELIGFTPSRSLDETNLPFVIAKCSYQAPTPNPSSEQKQRAQELLRKLADLLTQAILTPNRYILSKWSHAMDELWKLLDIEQDINEEIARMVRLVTNQKTAKNNSGCPYTCKTCWPNGPQKLDDTAEYQLPFTDPENLKTYCKSFLHPGVFHLSKIRRPESLKNLRHLYKLWLTKYSDDILDQLQMWGYDYRGQHLPSHTPIQTTTETVMIKATTQSITSVIELSDTALRTILDVLPTDSRLLLASASNQFSRMLATPDYRELTWLKCWATGAAPTEDVLGYPIMITPFKSRGPESTCIKEISSTLDVISYTAYKELKINRSVWNMEFGFFLPLYITPNHFMRARECLMKSIAAIYFNRGLSDKPTPHKFSQPPAVIINDIFATLLNSLIVEMMRGETHISMKALEGFTQLFRTWYHLAQADIDIRRQATRILTDFQTKIQTRHKRVTPNLGRLLMMICIAPNEFTWDTIREAYIEESRDRNILWILQVCPEIIQAKYWTEVTSAIPKVLEATIVGKRLQVFNKYFTELVKKPEFLEELDITYGYPGEDLKREFQQVMKQIYAMNSWDEYYRLTGQQSLTDSELARQIYWDTRTSTRKGYNISIKGVGAVLGNDLELLKLFESNHTLEEITAFFKKFRAINAESTEHIPLTLNSNPTPEWVENWCNDSASTQDI